MKRIVKGMGTALPLMALWMICCAVFWTFVFGRITDTSANQKIVLYVDAQVPGSTALAVALEEKGADGIRMVQVRPFSYAMFGSRDVQTADLYILPASHADTYRDWLCPLPEHDWQDAADIGEDDFLLLDGAAFGIRVYRAEDGSAAAGRYIGYGVGEETQEDYYLCFGASSLHVQGHAEAVDDAAVLYAERLLSMTD